MGSEVTLLYHSLIYFVCLYLPACISGWIFQKVLPEMVQKRLILSQKGLISNRCNFGLFAPKSMRFPSKTGNRKISLSDPRNFLQAIFPFSQNALESLYCSVILTAGFPVSFCLALKKHASFSSGYHTR